MSFLGQSTLQSSPAASLGERERWLGAPPLVRKNIASNGEAWLPLLMVFGAIGAVAYADHRVTSVSLMYLYILPLAVGAIFLRREISYSLIVICVLLHDYLSPRGINPQIRLFHNLSAMLCFGFLVYVIQRYVEQRETLANTVQRQRDDLLRDLEMAARVQRLFLPVGKPAIPGLEVAGMMQPAKVVGGDYYQYIPIDAHTIQLVVADVAGKGVPAALLMSATAAAMRVETNHDRNMLAQVGRLNAGIHALSDDERYVTLLVAEIDTDRRLLRYVNCGHNPALLFQASTGRVTRLNSSCLPIGLSPQETCELASAELMTDDMVVFYTDGVTEVENPLGEQFGLERLTELVRQNPSLSAQELMNNIYDATSSFCGDDFNDDVTILVVKCNFEIPSTVSS
jgi:serine phosphatase RsbU (regulator of sigma subunit)